MKAYLIASFKKPNQILCTYSYKNEALLHLALHPNHFYQEIDDDLLAGSYEEYDNKHDDLFYDYWLERQNDEE